MFCLYRKSAINILSVEGTHIFNSWSDFYAYVDTLSEYVYHLIFPVSSNVIAGNDMP